MKDNYSLALKVGILVCVPLLFQIFFVGVLGLLLSQAEFERREEAHAKDVATQATQILRLIVEAGAAAAIVEQARQFMNTDKLMRKSELAGDRAQREFEILKKMVQGRADEEAAVRQIGEVQDQIRQCIYNARRAIHRGDKFTTLSEYAKVHKLVSDFTNAVDLVTEQQNAIQREKAVRQCEARRTVTLFLLVGFLFNVCLALTMAFLFHRGTTSRLAVLMDNTGRLVRGQPLNPPVSGSDEIAHLDKVFQEMAAQLDEARRKERSIIQNAKDVICSLDKGGTFSAVNPACQTVWGYEPAELQGQSWRKLVIEEDQPKTEQMIEKIISGESSLPIENRVYRKDGTAVDVLWSVHWSEADDSLFCVAHDITDRKEVERLKREFVAMVSHDLRTPLSSIKMYLSMLSTGAFGTLNQSGRDNLSTADGCINRLMSLINDLLDAEKLESGRFELTLAPCSMGDILESAVMSVKGFADQQGVELDLIPYDCDIVADADRLVQVVVNLLANAVKFSAPASRVVISVREAGDQAEVRVSDRGRGIPEDFLDTIFDRFTQVSVKDARRGLGSGLGLSICKAIIEKHGGRIGVESKENEGSTFWFRITRCQKAATEGDVSRLSVCNTEHNTERLAET